MKWTMDMDKMLIDLRAMGCSSSQIAMKIGNVSREAVCGRAWRLNLPKKRISHKVSMERALLIHKSKGALR